MAARVYETPRPGGIPNPNGPGYLSHRQALNLQREARLGRPVSVEAYRRLPAHERLRPAQPSGPRQRIRTVPVGRERQTVRELGLHVREGQSLREATRGRSPGLTRSDPVRRAIEATDAPQIYVAALARWYKRGEQRDAKWLSAPNGPIDKGDVLDAFERNPNLIDALRELGFEIPEGNKQAVFAVQIRGVSRL